MTVLDNPYVGPRTFTQAESDRFYGREREAEELLALVISERLILFFAQSGAGKSSLINTRLVPGLQAANFVVLPVGRVSGQLPEGIDNAANVYALNLMLSLDQGDAPPDHLANLTLSHFLARLICDDPAGGHFYYSQAAPTQDGDAYIEPRAVLIIDQFEEIVTTHPEYWPHREAFFRQLNQAMADNPSLWLLLTMREDYIAALEPFAALLPGKLRARFHMQRMGYRAALEAVKMPAKRGGRPFAPRVAEKLIDNLRKIRVHGQSQPQLGEFVEPVQLQVVCYQLWENLNATAGIGSEITLDDLERLGDVDAALADYYEQAVQQVIQQTGVSEIALRNWFDRKLITEAGTRGLVYQGQHDTAGLPNPAIKVLADQFLLRADLKAKLTWYELTHDRFIEPILQANQSWWQRQSPLMRAAQAWDDAGRDPGKLYVGQQLAEAQASLGAGQPEPVVAAFLAASAAANQALLEKEAFRQRQLADAQALAEAQRQRAEEQERATRRFRAIALVLAAVFILALVAAALAWVQRQRAESASRQALQAEATAVAERDRAEQELLLSTSNELVAQSQINLDLDPDLSILLALQAIDTVDTPQAQEMLHRAVQAAHLSRTLAGHTDFVNSVAYAPDGSTLVSASDDGTVRVWRVETGQELMELSGHTGTVWSASFSPDGAQIATAGVDGTVRLWAAESGQELAVLSHPGALAAVAYRPDGLQLATGSLDGTVTIWEPGSGSQVSTFKAHDGLVTALAYSPDGSRIATASDDQTVRLWDATSGQELLVLTGHLNAVNSVAFQPAGALLATAGSDGTVRLWETETGQEVATLTGHVGSVWSVAYSPDGSRLASVGEDSTVRLWEASLGVQLLVLTGHTADVAGVTFSPDGQNIATAGADSTAKIWRIASPEYYFGHADLVNQVAYSPDGTRLASAGSDRRVRIWDTGSGQEVQTLLHDSRVVDVAFQPASGAGRLATASQDGLVRLWNVDSGEELLAMAHTDFVNGIAFSPDGARLASASSDGTARLWASDSGQEVLVLPHAEVVVDVAFSPDGARLATVDQAALVRLWDVATGQLELSFPGNSPFIWAVTYSPDGSRLLTAGDDGAVGVWAAGSGEPLFSLRGHQGAVRAVAFSPDGRRLATASDDRTTVVWAAASGERWLTLADHSDGVQAVAFSPDGRWLATGSQDRTVRAHPLDPEELQQLARSRLSRWWTPEECVQFIRRGECPPAP